MDRYICVEASALDYKTKEMVGILVSKKSSLPRLQGRNTFLLG